MAVVDDVIEHVLRNMFVFGHMAWYCCHPKYDERGEIVSVILPPLSQGPHTFGGREWKLYAWGGHRGSNSNSDGNDDDPDALDECNVLMLLLHLVKLFRRTGYLDIFANMRDNNGWFDALARKFEQTCDCPACHQRGCDDRERKRRREDSAFNSIRISGTAAATVPPPPPPSPRTVVDRSWLFSPPVLRGGVGATTTVTPAVTVCSTARSSAGVFASALLTWLVLFHFDELSFTLHQIGCMFDDAGIDYMRRVLREGTWDTHYKFQTISQFLSFECARRASTRRHPVMKVFLHAMLYDVGGISVTHEAYAYAREMTDRSDGDGRGGLDVLALVAASAAVPLLSATAATTVTTAHEASNP